MNPQKNNQQYLPKVISQLLLYYSQYKSHIQKLLVIDILYSKVISYIYTIVNTKVVNGQLQLPL